MLFDVAAKINTDNCIGCARCIKACPVDAIIGAPKKLHQVLESYCTGCEDCVAVCPVDCIDLVDATYSYSEKQVRERESESRTQSQQVKREKSAKRTTAPKLTTESLIKDDLANILLRARQRRQVKE